MATVAIAWGDGTADKITVTYTGAVGNSSMSVTSDPNKSLSQRNKTLTLKDSNGIARATLTVSQKPRSRGYSVSYNKAYK